jgi:hypothetical protein
VGEMQASVSRQPLITISNSCTYHAEGPPSRQMATTSAPENPSQATASAATSMPASCGILDS